MTSFLLTAVGAALFFMHAHPSTLRAAERAAEKTVLFFGDSITAGYGLEPDEAYPALIQKRIKDKGWPFVVRNAGLSGDTTAAGKQRLSWVLRPGTEVVVLALGGNDGLRGTPPAATRQNLQDIITTARDKAPGVTVILAGMQMPPNYGPSFTREFSSLFPDLARKNKIPLIPFLLKDVGGIADMNLPDRIHPNPAGQRVIADTVWKVLEPVLAAKLSSIE